MENVQQKPQATSFCYERIHGGQLNDMNFQNKRVGFIGKVMNIMQNQIQLQMNEGEDVEVRLFNWQEPLTTLPKFIEMRGMNTNGGFEIEEYTLINEEDFDLKMYNEFIKISQNPQFVEMFRPVEQVWLCGIK